MMLSYHRVGLQYHRRDHWMPEELAVPTLTLPQVQLLSAVSKDVTFDLGAWDFAQLVSHTPLSDLAFDMAVRGLGLPLCFEGLPLSPEILLLTDLLNFPHCP